MRLGIMGGTFDPLHWVHLIMAEQARVGFGLDKVLFIPAANPPHKSDRVVADAEHRYAMTLLGTAGNLGFEVSRIEMERSGPSYSVDTIRELKKMYGPQTDVFFILGADEALDLMTWHEAENLPHLMRFIVAPRPGFNLKELERHLSREFLEVIDLLPMNPVEISSTELRRKVAAGESIRYLVPESVEVYIKKHGLYKA